MELVSAVDLSLMLDGTWCCSARTIQENQVSIWQNEMRAGLNISIPCSTVHRRLIAVHLHGRVAARKPPLRPQSKVKRLKFARQHQDWATEQWNWVLWSHELKFELFGSKRCQYVHPRPGERCDAQCLQPTVKHRGGSVTVSGCISYFSVGKLVKINGTRTKDNLQADTAAPCSSEGKSFHQSEEDSFSN